MIIFYHYDTENMSISIGNKNQSRFKNRYERCVIVTYFRDSRANASGGPVV